MRPHYGRTQIARRPRPALSRWARHLVRVAEQPEAGHVRGGGNARSQRSLDDRRAADVLHADGYHWKPTGWHSAMKAALKCLYLLTRSLDSTGRGKARWAMRWKPALNAFAITFEGRINPAGN